MCVCVCVCVWGGGGGIVCACVCVKWRPDNFPSTSCDQSSGVAGGQPGNYTCTHKLGRSHVSRLNNKAMCFCKLVNSNTFKRGVI